MFYKIKYIGHQTKIIQTISCFTPNNLPLRLCCNRVRIKQKGKIDTESEPPTMGRILLFNVYTWKQEKWERKILRRGLILILITFLDQISDI